MICIKTAHVPKERQTNYFAEWVAYIEEKLKESRLKN